MIKLLPVFIQIPGQTRAESAEHYRLNHSRLCASIEEFNRHMCKYVQNYAIDDQLISTRNGFAPVGVSECWFYSAEGFWDGYGEARYQELRDDECRFVDMEKLILVPARPATIFGASTDAPFKVFRFANYAAGVERGAARKFWETAYASAISHDPDLRSVIHTYVQNRPIPDFSTNFPPSSASDIADEFWLDDLDALQSFQEAEARIRQSLDYKRFIDEDQRIEFVSKTNILWELGEAPSNALTRSPLLEESIV